MLNESVATLKKLYAYWSEDKIAIFAAALAYYTAFALAPFVILCTSVIGLVYGHHVAEGQLLDQIRMFLGKDSAELIQTMIVIANKPSSGITAQVISIILLILATTGVFGQLQMGLNTIWGVHP